MQLIKHATILLLACISMGHSSFAQSAGKISGTILANGEKAIGATVALLNVKDSSLVKRTATNNLGEFVFEQVAEGKYRVGATAVGFQKVMSPMIEITSQQKTIAVPAITLTPAASKLNDVKVTTNRPMIEQRIDRTIINVEAAITNAGSSAFEVLEKAPGVSIDREGNISLKGKEGVLVMVDGRPTEMAAADLANMLRNMNASQLDQIEIMTNPPARYDAAGNAGIINIKTKKIVTAGYNGTGSVNYMQGRYPKANTGFNFNYREQKVNVFANFGHNYRKSYEDNTIRRNIRNSSNNIINFFDLEANKITEANGFSSKVGIDFFVDKKTTVGLAVNGATNHNTLSNFNNTNIYTASKELESITTASGANTNNWNRISTNLFFRRVLNKKGSEISGDVDFIDHRSKFSMDMVNNYPYNNGSGQTTADTLLGNLPQNVQVYSGRIDYSLPFGKNSKLEAGAKSSIVRTDNNAQYDSLQNGALLRDINRSNHFIYQENINAAYVNVVQPISKKLNAQLGLRLENTNATGRQLTTGKDFDRHYTQLFPTAYLQYKLNDKHTLAANLGRRVQRPNYQSLNPFIRFIDRYTYSEGNPNLRPSVSNNVEFTHMFKNMFTTTLNYTATNDIINSVLEQQGREVYHRPTNIASLRQVGIAVNANNNITKWWSSNIMVNAFYNRYKGVVNNNAVDLSATSCILMAMQQFKLSKTVSAELSGRYRTGWLEGIFEAQPLGIVWAGVSKQVMKNQGTVRLTVRDIFHSQVFKGTARYSNVDVFMQEVNDTRMVMLGFTYRFSKGKKVAPVKRTAGSANEEEGRIEQ
ncbi:TonB-dependent receptor domain-containing protein [Aridibaculum aurantiacum]|uniref:TonB-dependent receptor domain-containing protein n=1 Tax=Aridibaculum aurantiacum TaxID=2810307 RepID=UPI001A97A621|nr:TonB-dependent receptor [Aridibaculum aurantiacum]